MASGVATVKEVLSGDTLVLIGAPKNGPPPEIRLTLASLQAPRLANNAKAGETKDEAWAWASREFLRKLCIGKQVAFKVEYTVPSINRSFGSVVLLNSNKENLCVTVARAGWARVKKDYRENEASADIEEMKRLGDAAESSRVGIFQDPSSPDAFRDVTFEVVSATEYLSKIKGQKMMAIVEYVRDGASFRVLLLSSMTFISLNLAGVQCPRVNANQPEPFAREAKYFTEIRLLNRNVEVVVDGVDNKFGTFYGNILHPAGDIGHELLVNGLAKTADWSMSFTSLERASRLRSAAKQAKDGKLRIWRNFVAPTISGTKTFEGVVSEVISADSLNVLVGSAEAIADKPWLCEERRVSLSSVRAPRRGGRDERGEPYSEEGRELLRTKVLGKRCKVTIEYERLVGENLRKFGTVMVSTRKGRKNAAALLVEAGFVSVVRHRADEERSGAYDELLVLESVAKEKSLGIFSEKEYVPKAQPIDLTASAAQAKAHLGHLQSKTSGVRPAGTHRAVVDYVIHGGRYRIRIPEENYVLNFALAGVQCPQGARPAMKGKPATKAEPHSMECSSYVKSLIMQRDVVVVVETMDKGGTAIGILKYKKGLTDMNLGVELVKAGLASVNAFSAQFSSCGEELFAEEAIAKSKRLNIWANYEEKAAEESPVAEANSGGERRMASCNLSVAEVLSGSRFFFQLSDDATKVKAASVEAEMQKYASQFGTSANQPGIMEPRRNMSCIALFNDGSGMKWFRAKILQVSKGQVTVRYIDFGNDEAVPDNRLRPCPQEFSIPPLAQEGTLALVKVPSLDKEYGHEAAVLFNDLVWGKELLGKVHGNDSDGKRLLSLFVVDKSKDPSEYISVSQVLVSEGLAFVASNAGKYLKLKEEKAIHESLSSAQNRAHKSHLRLWQYGDPRDEEI